MNVVNGCIRDVIWQNNFCQTLVNNTILPPRNSLCRFYIADTMSFINNYPNTYENVYQVDTEQEMMDCDASNPVNIVPLIVNGTSTLSLVISSDFQFTVSKVVYLISTSSGSEESALTDRTRNISCLQMSFHLVSSSNKNCTLQTVCESSVLNDESIFDLGCKFGVFATETNQASSPISTSITTPTVMPTSTITNELTNSESMTSGTVSPGTSSSTDDNGTPDTKTQNGIPCITVEYNLPEYFCLDWIIFPIASLILIVSIMIIIACNIMCYLKHWLCFYYYRKNMISPNDLYEPPHIRGQMRLSRTDYENMPLENINSNQNKQTKVEIEPVKKISTSTPLFIVDDSVLKTESLGPCIQPRGPAPDPPSGALPPLRVKPIKVIGNSDDYQNI